jgi:hypothetical protein
MKIVDILLVVFCAFSIILCLILSFGLLKWPESTVTIILMNMFFVPLLSQIGGKVSAKACMLIVGNLTALTLNVLLLNFAKSIYDIFGLPTSALLTIVYPILNLMWIVPFWSLTLSFLSKTSPGKAQS